MPRGERPFFVGLAVLGGGYVLLIVAMLAADLFFTSTSDLEQALGDRRIQFAIRLSLVTTLISASLSTLVAIPLGYLLSRARFPGKHLVDAVVDIPIVLPPLVIGLSLLILFRSPPGRLFERHLFGVIFQAPSVVIAQFTVAAAFAVRAMKISFDQMTPRTEEVAMTLGCSRAQALFRVVIPEARRGILAAFAIAWARSLGEFGPVMVFSGTTRMRTEVLSSSVFLELSVGRLEAAVAVSLLMVAMALTALVVLRYLGPAEALGRSVRP